MLCGSADHLKYIFQQPCPPPAAPNKPEASTCITEHPHAVCRSVWLGRSRNFLIKLGEERDGGWQQQGLTAR